MNLDELAHMRSYARDLVERACTYTGSRRAHTHVTHTDAHGRTHTCTHTQAQASVRLRAYRQRLGLKITKSQGAGIVQG